MTLPLAFKKLLIRTGAARFLPAAKRRTEGSTEYLRYYSDTVLDAPVDELLDPFAFPDAHGNGVLNLNEPAPRFDSPVSMNRITAERGGMPPTRGSIELREVIADHYRNRDARKLDPEREVLITHGATGAFAAALDAFVNPGDRVALFTPCSPMFAVGAKSRRARVRWIPTETENGRLTFEYPALLAAMRGAKLLAIADPANPTGGAISSDDLERIAWLAQRYDVLLYLDESFSRFRYDGRPCGLAAIPQMERRTLSAGSLTQGYGLGSVRIGWLTGPKPLVRACTLTATLSAPFVPTLCQQVSLRALTAGDEVFAPTLEQFRSKRRYAFDKLTAMGLRPKWPSGGYFLWVPVAQLGLSGRTFAQRLLTDHRVAVGPGCVYGPSGDGFVRISFAAEDGRLREGLTRLAEFVEGLKGKPVVKSATISVQKPIEPPIEDKGEVSPDEPVQSPSFSRV